MRIFLILFLLFFNLNAYANQQKSQDVLFFNSLEGKERLMKSKYNQDFFQLINFYQAQINPLYCSAATSVMILNAFEYGSISSQKSAEVKKPQSLGGGVIEYNLYLQENFFNDKTDKIKKREIIELKSPKIIKNGEEIYDAGLTLVELDKILRKIYKLKVTKIHAKKNDEKSLEKFRQNLKKYLNEDKKFIIVNFDGKILGTKTRGHISPLVAYDEITDSVLILDVALHKNLWYFASVEKLFEAMNSKDGQDYRGYLIVSND